MDGAFNLQLTQHGGGLLSAECPHQMLQMKMTDEERWRGVEIFGDLGSFLI